MAVPDAGPAIGWARGTRWAEGAQVRLEPLSPTGESPQRHTRFMKGLLLLAASIGLSASQVPALSASPSEQELHTAQCVAALEASTDEFAVQVKSGRAEVQPAFIF